MANSRGLLNSSIAVGAARDAVLKNALPIAQQDAQTYTKCRCGERIVREFRRAVQRKCAELFAGLGSSSAQTRPWP